MPNAYLDTVGKLEPEIHPIDAGAFYASAAISLKRIADTLEKTQVPQWYPVIDNKLAGLPWRILAQGSGDDRIMTIACFMHQQTAEEALTVITKTNTFRYWVTEFK